MRFLHLPFQTKRNFEMMKTQLAKRSIILMPRMFRQPLHSNTVSLKKRKMAFFEPPTRKEYWEKKQQPLTTHSSTLGQHSFMMFQSTNNLPKCNSANLEQSLWEVKTSGRQRQSSCRVFLWKGIAHFIFMYTSLFLYMKPSKGKCDFISSKVSDSTSRSHTHTEAILSVS